VVDWKGHAKRVEVDRRLPRRVTSMNCVTGAQRSRVGGRACENINVVLS